MTVLRRSLIAVSCLLPSLLVGAPAAQAHPAQLNLLHTLVHPGDIETVTAHDLPGEPGSLEVHFPDGEGLWVSPHTSRKTGITSWTFIQPPGTVARHSQRATVRLVSDYVTYVRHYTVAFDPIDLIAPFVSVENNAPFTLWVHTAARTAVELDVARFKAACQPCAGFTSRIEGSTAIVRRLTGADGWAAVRLRMPNDTYPFVPMHIRVVARAIVHGRPRSARASFDVRPFRIFFIFINVAVLDESRHPGTPTTTIYPGERVQVQATGVLTEPAGEMAMCTKEATVSVFQQSTGVGALAAVQCPPGSPGATVATLTVPTAFVPGDARIVVGTGDSGGGILDVTVGAPPPGAAL